MKRVFCLLCILSLSACLVACARTAGSTPSAPLVSPESSPSFSDPPDLPDDVFPAPVEDPESEVPTAPLLPTGEAPEEISPVAEPKEVEPDAEPPVPEKVRYVRSKVDALYIRIGAGRNFASLGTLDAGDMAAYYGESNGWYETRYRGRVAYVSANPAYTELYETDPSTDDVESVIAVGCLYLGAPYVYGAVRYMDASGAFLRAFSPDAFDCSSLMQYIFYEGAGVVLQVNTRTQVSQGAPVSFQNLARGDLLFFTNASRKNKVGVERIGHVALYLGDGYILHTASDHAVIEPLSPSRIANFICARRVF